MHEANEFHSQFNDIQVYLHWPHFLSLFYFLVFLSLEYFHPVFFLFRCCPRRFYSKLIFCPNIRFSSGISITNSKVIQKLIKTMRLLSCKLLQRIKNGYSYNYDFFPFAKISFSLCIMPLNRIFYSILSHNFFCQMWIWILDFLRKKRHKFVHLKKKHNFFLSFEKKQAINLPENTLKRAKFNCARSFNAKVVVKSELCII